MSFDLWECEQCGRFCKDDEFHRHEERHGPHMTETLYMTDCCNAGAEEVTPERVVSYLGEIEREFMPPTRQLLTRNRQLRAHNLEQIQIILEKEFEL